MKLSRIERWILFNQYQMLARLCPEEARAYARYQEALQCGYEAEYDTMAQHIYREDSCLSAEECNEVVTILDMFRALKQSYEGLADTSGIEPHAVQFMGFDGNNETTRMAYARYFCESDLPRFEELHHRGGRLNSHMPVLGIYRRMLAEWNRIDQKYELSKDEILRIVSVRRAPED
jgi:uncharacterized protein YfbU (UPF0304 family)